MWDGGIFAFVGRGVCVCVCVRVCFVFSCGYVLLNPWVYVCVARDVIL